MKHQSHIDMERERNRKVSEVVLYDSGQYDAESVFREMDDLLEEYKDLNVPDGLDRWFSDFFDETEKKATIATRRKNLRRFAVSAAAILLIFVVLTITVTMSVSAYRLRVLNYLLQKSEKVSTVNITENIDGQEVDLDAFPSEWHSFYYPDYLPIGYVLHETSGNAAGKTMTFIDENGTKLIFNQTALTASVQLDTEDADVIEVDVNGESGLLLEEGEGRMVYWYNKECSFMMYGDIDRDTLMEIVKNIRKIKK